MKVLKMIETSYSRKDILNLLRNEYPDASEDSLSYRLRKMQDDNQFIRIGRNHYTVSSEKKIYRYSYSDTASEIADHLCQNFYELDFRIFELVQLNEFMNHQIAHNTIFLSVEQDLTDFVFDSLVRRYPGKTMLKPKPDDYFRYRQDDEIVISRLPTESPKGTEMTWHSRLEKILVDITVDKLQRQIIPPSEYGNIFHNAYECYFLDEKTMIRYARRRGAEAKFESALNQYAPKENVKV